MIPVALTIAGSDPSGGAGIQADLKTFAALKVYGMSVLTALTAQNTAGIFGIMDVPSEFLAKQMDAVMTDIRPGAVKSGMISSAGNLEVVIRKVRQYNISRLVVDPVMVSTSGTALLAGDAVEVLRRYLMPLALVVTPNLSEARALTGQSIASVDDMEEAALQIHGFGPKYVFLKGGHLDGEPVDVLFDGNEFKRFRGERVETTDSHGTGCILSAAIAGYLARGEPVEDAVRLAKNFVTAAIRHGLRLGSGHGPCDPLDLQGG